jgi:hypothetical protein
MEIIVEQVMNDKDLEAIMRIREQVFVRELGIALAPLSLSENGRATFLLARVGPDKQPVGSLCVMDTSYDHQLHESFGLQFESKARVARYTHLAVLEPYRGLHIPLAMMLEAHRRVSVPHQFDYTWLLFDVERALNSFLVNQLGFSALPGTFVSEYGCRCPLVREERTLNSRQVISRAEQYLRQVQSLTVHKIAMQPATGARETNSAI